MCISTMPNMDTEPRFYLPSQAHTVLSAFVQLPFPPLRRSRTSIVTKSSLSRSWATCCAKGTLTTPSEVSILFQPEGVRVQASPGEPLTEVAYRGGVGIIQGCGVGDCGTCEVYLERAGERFVVRSCVEPVPHEDVIVDDSVGLGMPY